jgi:protein-tyrosine-phosphatase
MNAEVRATNDALDLLKLLAHGIRWHLLTKLSRGDYTVGELTSAIGQPDNLVSYHLAQLRRAGLVSERRSDADGRDVYYTVDAERLRDRYLSVGAALHPSLVPVEAPAAVAGKPARSPRVLFLCTGNSARSQMAEALLRELSKGIVEARSAGISPSSVDPDAARTLQEIGLDVSGLRSKHLDEFAGEHFDYVITVCDRMKESCPVYPDDTARIHWSFADPAVFEGTPEQRLRAFRETSLQLSTRVRLLLTVIARDSAAD